MTAVLIRNKVPRIAPRANWGRWIVDCPKVPTHALWVDRFQPWFECPACGAVAELVWASEDMVLGIERLLMMRPNEANRNWEPGESLHDLLGENIDHGIWQGDDAGGQLSIVGDKITVDTLPVPLVRGMTEAFILSLIQSHTPFTPPAAIGA